MKIALYIIVFLFSFNCYTCLAQKPTTLNALTTADRANYSLTIAQVAKASDPCGSPRLTYLVDAILKNNSNDTLTYIDMTHSMIWYIDNSKMDAYPTGSGCDGGNDGTENIIVTYKVPPHQSKNIELYVVNQAFSPTKLKYRIGMILQRMYNYKDFGILLNAFTTNHLGLAGQTMNLIWSNTLDFPYSPTGY